MAGDWAEDDEYEVWRSVANAINERLEDLAWDQAALVRASGVSATTIRWLQTASQLRYRPTTLAKVSKALGWPANAIEQIRTKGIIPEPFRDPDWPQRQTPFEDDEPEDDEVAVFEDPRLAALASGWKELPEEDREHMAATFELLRRKHGK